MRRPGSEPRDDPSENPPSTAPRARHPLRRATAAAGPVDWAEWMRQLGARVRRVREFVGLSQEQLARLAGVSQGAVSRLEAGRGLATPLLVLMKINLPLLRALRSQDPSLLNDELRRMLDSAKNITPPVGDMGYESLPLTRDPGLEEIVRLYRGLPARQRRMLLSVTRATASSLAGTEPPLPEHEA